ncbi:hypothetical protein [Paraburkholderia domus]|uniref:hypothetical protein n=1 Tax=Paraburkholderia domus TaxID=2793075 RepID=UPI00191142EF|nr:hypothetical protein [Paraburkholderia domus]MBK5065764.1 hypothetical protein [Burkholderia sp. R-70199]CAE6962846.1 hypothetical protein R70199_07451 [Paraburkholderia domus]
MFGIYPAGANWRRQFTSSEGALVIQERLTTFAGMEAGTLTEPFGRQRGAVIARHHGFLVMADMICMGPEIVVVPDVHLQHLLWSFNTGNAEQWSGRELKVMTGSDLDSWDALLIEASRKFRWTVNLVEQAIAGTLRKEEPQAAATAGSLVPELDSYPDDSWVPVFDHVPFDGDLSCVL